MRHILIAGGVIGFLLGIGLLFDSRWGESSLVRGAAVMVAAAISLAIGLAACDIVAEIKRNQEIPDAQRQHAREGAAQNRAPGDRA
jgi:hypothetical protein